MSKFSLLLLGLVVLGLLAGCDVISQNATATETPATAKAPATTQPPLILKQQFLSGTFFSSKIIELNLVERWLYSDSEQLAFKSLNPPYVVNAAIRQKTSQVITEMTVTVYKKGDP